MKTRLVEHIEDRGNVLTRAFHTKCSWFIAMTVSDKRARERLFVAESGWWLP